MHERLWQETFNWFFPSPKAADMTWAKKKKKRVSAGQRATGWVKWRMEAVWSILSLVSTSLWLWKKLQLSPFLSLLPHRSVIALVFCPPNRSFTTTYLFRLSSGQWSRAESVCVWLIQVKSSAECQLSHMVCLAAVCAWRSRAWLQQHRWLWCSDGSQAHDTSLHHVWEACVEQLRGFIYLHRCATSVRLWRLKKKCAILLCIPAVWLWIKNRLFDHTGSYNQLEANTESEDVLKMHKILFLKIPSTQQSRAQRLSVPLPVTSLSESPPFLKTSPAPFPHCCPWNVSSYWWVRGGRLPSRARQSDARRPSAVTPGSIGEILGSERDTEKKKKTKSPSSSFSSSYCLQECLLETRVFLLEMLTAASKLRKAQGHARTHTRKKISSLQK